MSVAVTPYLFLNLGRERTSAISSSMGSEMTAVNSPCSKEDLNKAGYPEGLSKAEIQMLVSITALTVTFFLPALFNGLSDVCFYLFTFVLSSLLVYFLDDAVKSFLPFVFGKDSNLNFFVLFDVDLFQRLKHAVFKYGIDDLAHSKHLLIIKFRVTKVRNEVKQEFERNLEEVLDIPQKLFSGRLGFISSAQPTRSAQAGADRPGDDTDFFKAVIFDPHDIISIELKIFLDIPVRVWFIPINCFNSTQ